MARQSTPLCYATRDPRGDGTVVRGEVERPEGGGFLQPYVERNENHLLRVLPSQSSDLQKVNIVPSGHSSDLFDQFKAITTPYGFLELEDLAAMLETTVDYVVLEFLPDR